MIPKRLKLPLSAIAVSFLCLSLPLPSFPWAKDQHEVIGEIAEMNLTPEAKKAVATILGSADRLSDIAIWADTIKRDRRETAPWHYVNFPLDLYEPSSDIRDTEKGNIVTAIEEQIAILDGRRGDTTGREEALKFLVHFVGDLHQPLHCGCAADRGGNTFGFYRKGKVTNLHSFWDAGAIPREKGKSVRAWAEELQRGLDPAARLELMQGGPFEWMVESRRIVKDFCYPRLRRFWPFSSQKKVFIYEDSDLAAAKDIAAKQLLKAGLRLAAVLNRIYAAPPAPASPPPAPVASAPASAQPEANSNQ